MKNVNVFLFVFYIIVVLCIPQYAQAQSVQSGEYFRQEGNASWYGHEFEGRRTASGEIFNSSLLTAAHPTLPFGTLLRVTNRNNNRQAVVKVNDRGPFVATRIIDVSRAAAEQLDMIYSGVAPVYIETVQGGYSQPYEFPAVPTPAQPPQVYYLPPQAFTQPQIYTPPPPPLPPPPPPLAVPPAVEKAPAQADTQPIVPFAPVTVTVYAPPQTPPSGSLPQISVVPPPPAITEYMPPQTAPFVPEYMPPPAIPSAKLTPPTNLQPGKAYKLQVGSYQFAQNAVNVFTKLKAAGLNPAYERAGDLYRVMLPGIRGSDIQSVSEKLMAAGFSEAVIREDN